MNQINSQNTEEVKVEQVKNNEEQNNQIPIEQPVQEQIEDKNWAAIREQRKADRKAREEAEKRAREKAEEAAALKAALEAIANKPSPVFNTGYQEEETEEQRLDRIVESRLKQREEQQKKERHEKEMREFPTMLRQKYPDFEKVCTAENLDYLDYLDPDIGEPYKYMPEGFKKWELIYKEVKKNIPNLDIKKEAAKIDKNLSKPGSISSAGTTQPPSTGSSNILSEQRKQENWARMQRDRKGLR